MYYTDSLTKEVKARLNSLRQKGDTYVSIVHRLISYYEVHENLRSSDLTTVLTELELLSYRRRKHDYDVSNQVVKEVFPHTDRLDQKQIRQQQKNYFEYKQYLEDKYQIELVGDI